MPTTDVLVSAVLYDKDHTRIEYLKIHYPINGLAGEGMDVRRETVVDLIERQKKSVYTYYEEDGTWVTGAPVRVTSKKFIRTKADDTEEDNLENLPEMGRVHPRV